MTKTQAKSQTNAKPKTGSKAKWKALGQIAKPLQLPGPKGGAFHHVKKNKVWKEIHAEYLGGVDIGEVLREVSASGHEHDKRPYDVSSTLL